MASSGQEEAGEEAGAGESGVGEEAGCTGGQEGGLAAGGNGAPGGNGVRACGGGSLGATTGGGSGGAGGGGPRGAAAGAGGDLGNSDDSDSDPESDLGHQPRRGRAWAHERARERAMGQVMSLYKVCWPRHDLRHTMIKTARSRTRIHSKGTVRTFRNSFSKSPTSSS